jgi:hypothetical protein
MTGLTILPWRELVRWRASRCLLISGLLLMLGCGPGEQRAGQQGTSGGAQQEASDRDECARSEPAALLPAGSSFVVTPAGEALETVDTTELPSLVIRHYGCAHFALDFTFRWPDTASPGRADALKTAASRLESLAVTEAAQPVMRRVIEGIGQLLADPEASELRLGEIERLELAIPSENVLVITYDVAL